MSHGYVIHNSSAYETFTANETRLQFSLTNLPAGTYMVTAVGNASISPATFDADNGGILIGIFCTLTPGASSNSEVFNIDNASPIVPVANGLELQANLSVTVVDAVTITAGEPITMTCTAPIAARSNNSVISAVALDGLN